VLPAAEQEKSLERAIWHREQADEVLLKSLITDHHQWTGSLRAREILDHWNEALPRFVKVFPNEYKRALAEISLKAMTALGEIRASSEAEDAIAKARTGGKAVRPVVPK
jgi:glutamate synthase (NADPH/NADH) large chain